MDIKAILKPAIILCIICAIITAALSITNVVTKDKIAELQFEAEQATARQIIEAEELVTLKYTFDDKEYTYYKAQNSEQVIGYVFKTSAKGYNGEVTVMTGIDTEGKIILVKILAAADETPGLGQNITKESFTSKFTGLVGTVGFTDDGSTDNAIDAVTGATYSSNAVANSVNTAVKIFNEIKEG